MHVALWTVVHCLTCVHKSVMPILRWQVRVLICAAVRVPEMHKDAVLVWTKFVNVQSVLESAPSVADAKITRRLDKPFHEVLENQAGRI